MAPSGLGEPIEVAVDLVSSPSWEGSPLPTVAAVITSFGRCQYLRELLEHLGDQDLGKERYEVVVVDNGSRDATWETLVDLVGRSALRIRAIRLPGNLGPGGGRNAGVRHVRSEITAFTDDDCLPQPAWLSTLVAAFGDGITVVQGAVRPHPPDLPRAGPWDHKIDIGGMTPWFETANVAYRTADFRRISGFDEQDPLTASAGGKRAFGEDALLAARVLELGGKARFSAEAVVHHRVVPSSYRRTLKEWRALTGFPSLVRRCGPVRASLFARVFLNRQTATFDLAVLGGLAVLIRRSPFGVVAAVPWALRRWMIIRATIDDRPRALGVLVQRSLVELVGLLSLVQGSIRYRRLVL